MQKETLEEIQKYLIDIKKIECSIIVPEKAKRRYLRVFMKDQTFEIHSLEDFMDFCRKTRILGIERLNQQRSFFSN